MTVVVCTECGERSQLRSQFEEDGPCPECGAEESLVAEDSWIEAPQTLRCTVCGREVDGLAPGVPAGPESARYSVDDDCPSCEHSALVPADSPAGKAKPAETGLARRIAEKLTAGLSAPVDVQRLAIEAGLTVQRKRFEHDGMLNGTTIEVPIGNHGSERFVIAHELGHRLLRHRVPEARIEQEANAFASELLMPAKLVRVAVAEGLNLPQLCRRFAVNRQPMLYALGRMRLLHQVRKD